MKVWGTKLKRGQATLRQPLTFGFLAHFDGFVWQGLSISAARMGAYY
jgi:hypothetical protein